MMHMLEHMRTTLNISDDLMRRVKKRAAETGTTITEDRDFRRFPFLKIVTLAEEPSA